MKKYPAIYRYLLLGLAIVILTGCATAGTVPTLSPSMAGGQSSDSQGGQPASWNEATHGKDAEPNYAVVFPQDAVNRIDITLSEEAWAGLQAEMTEQFGAQGEGSGDPGQMPGGPGGGPREMPGDPGDPGQAPGDPGDQQNGQGFPRLDFGDTSYVNSTVSFNGETWEQVGFRYSGNSTLQSSWRSGTQKISFRLDFDEFEDEYPATSNQRFYGFKQLAFKSNAMDSSYLREKVVADIFREAGVVASQTAFYEVYVDSGEGPQYFGLYTAVEVVDDTVIETQFADGSGNVYKPEGAGAAFVDGTFSEESFEKQTNAEEADWSDIQAVFAALNSAQRSSDPAAWRAGLEAVFDVEAFIRWLAVDTIIQNWDTYGAAPHNYYLYTDPSDGLVTWIPWDNNMALSANAMGPGGGGPGDMPPGGGPPAGNNPRGGNREGGAPGGGNRGVRTLDLSSVSEQWPLIRFLMDDPVYLARYQQYLEETIQGAFSTERLAAMYQKYHDLIAASVQKEIQGYTQLESVESFDQSVEGLIRHAEERYAAVVQYLEGQGNP